MVWCFHSARPLIQKIESMAPLHGAHVALTGGVLYKDGVRKDLDLLFYRIRQVKKIDETTLIGNLQDLGLVIGKTHGWVTKATYEGKGIDLFFPDRNDKSGGQY